MPFGRLTTNFHRAHPSPKATRLGVAIVVLTVLWLPTIGTQAQVSRSNLDALQQRLDSARARVQSIQAQALTVNQQIASIDKQAAAVADALEAANVLVSRTKEQISETRARVLHQQRVYETADRRARAIAVALYKAGPGGELDTVLSATSIDELVTRVHYASVSASNRIDVMVAARRSKLQLDAAKRELAQKLTEAVAQRNARIDQAQHLKELRAAQGQKLAALRRQIGAQRQEAQQLAAKSDSIAALLRSASQAAPVAPAAPAAPAPVRRSASGFAWPISGAITSGFGERWGRMHTGIDIDCVTGNPIHASRAGQVVSTSYDPPGYGYYIVLDHGGGFGSLYAHLSSMAVSAGQSVSQGQVIGACGATGDATGDHLHFEIRVNGVPQNPLNYLP